ncbi:hypothetical protein BKA64DRAFT_748546 [Cadophora sp. MPI-SDFR-AT-0126]|nr:hypothetical protein BKA64DRAFT_748546 [Leotiomycetes sp. MPI-SDFR-AT-0126]
MSGPTEDTAVVHQAANHLGTTSNPNHWVWVRANELESMQEQIRQLKDEVTGMKETTAVLTTFTLFPKLPLELRLKVWREVMHVEEVFTMGYNKIEHRVRSRDQFQDSQCQLLLATAKSNLMIVNKETRDEGKRVLSRFTYRGRSTWYNSETDITMFPDFNIDTSEMCGDGLLEGPRIHRIAIPYRYWSPTAHMSMDSIYHEFYQFSLSQLVLILGPKDLRRRYGTESISSTSRPADFVLHEDPDMPTACLSWEALARREMLKMKIWKTGIEIAREIVKKEEGLTEEELDEDNSLWTHFSIPNITFRFQDDALTLID